MIKLKLNTDLFSPALVSFTRRLNNLEITVSPEVQGYTLTSAEGEVISAGDDRRELIKLLRDSLRR